MNTGSGRPGPIPRTRDVSPFFYPPRAAQSPWWKRAQRRLDHRFERFMGRMPAPRDPEVIAAASLVPGLGHLLLERKAGKAAAYFAAYWLILIWTTLFAQVDLWLFTLGVFSFHQWVMTDAYRKARARLGLPALRGRALIVFSLVTGAALATGYRQIGQAASGYGTVLNLKTDRFQPLLYEGDRLLIARRPPYLRGDIVYSAKREGLERVVGVAGDQIAYTEEGLLVNGSPPSGDSAPLAAPSKDLLRAQSRVPAGSYCVFFTARSHNMRSNRLLDFFIIPEKDIDGRLTLRYYPDWRRFK